MKNEDIKTVKEEELEKVSGGSEELYKAALAAAEDIANKDYTSKLANG